MKRFISSYMKVTRTSQLRYSIISLTMENEAPVHPNGSMKANVGGGLAPLALNEVSSLPNAASKVSPPATSTWKFLGVSRLSTISLSTRARSLSFSTNRNRIVAAECLRCSRATRSAIIGDPSSPLEYRPGPAKPSIYSTSRNPPCVRIGVQACRYRFSISCFARVWGSRSQTVVFGAAIPDVPVVAQYVSLHSRRLTRPFSVTGYCERAWPLVPLSAF